jgi:hypothetical protein
VGAALTLALPALAYAGTIVAEAIFLPLRDPRVVAGSARARRALTAQPNCCSWARLRCLRPDTG